MALFVLTFLGRPIFLFSPQILVGAVANVEKVVGNIVVDVPMNHCFDYSHSLVIAILEVVEFVLLHTYLAKVDCEHDEHGDHYAPKSPSLCYEHFPRYSLCFEYPFHHFSS